MPIRSIGRIAVLPRVAAIWLAVAAGSAPATAQPVALHQRLTHPDGITLELQNINLRPDSTVVSTVIVNPGDRAIWLDRARSFVLDDSAHGIHRLNPPIDNPELQIAPHSRLDAELVFIGPLAPSAPRVTLSANQGIGTPDNPYDDMPVLTAALTLPSPRAADVHQVDHPDGATLRINRLTAASGRCVAVLQATNGNERTIVLNRNHSLVLSNDGGVFAPLDPPADNLKLIVPAGSRLDATLVFDCRALADVGELTLSTNRGTAGTPDNPHETMPVFAMRLPVEHAAEGATAVDKSRATITPIARSVLIAATTATALAVIAAAPPTQPPAATASPPPAAPPVPVPPRQAQPAPPIPKTEAELKAALRATNGYHGTVVTLPADPLFGTSQDTLAPNAESPLSELAALIAAAHPREVVVAGHTDSSGDDDANMALSKARAHVVAAWLAARPERRRPRIVEQGYGRTRPIAPNHKADGSDNPEGRAQNRRVEITLVR